MSTDPGERDDRVPSPGTVEEPEPGTEETTTTEEPVAGVARAGEEPRGEGKPGEGGTGGDEAWDALPEWGREEIRRGRRASRRAKEAAIQAGWTYDDKTGEFIPPEPTAPARREEPAPRVQVGKTGLPVEREQHYARRFREAEIADDPIAARMEASAEMGSEIADQRLRRGLDLVLPATLRGAVDSYKDTFRRDRDPARAEAFKLAEPEFDQVIKEAAAESRKSGVPFIPNDELMTYLRGIAIDRALPKILSTAGTRRDQQRGAAARVNGAVRVAGSSTTTGAPATPTLDDSEKRIIGSLARGAGVDPTVLEKGYAARKGRGE